LNKVKRNLIVASLVLIGLCSFASAKEYDGIWFLGMNVKSDLLKNTRVRDAIDLSLSKTDIALNIASKEVVPLSVIPPGMIGYDPDLDAPFRNLKEAKSIMQKAGYPMSDQRIKNLSLLHTDGLKTVAIAKKIQNDLRNIGMKINLVEVSYQDQGTWVKELASGKHDFYLMGYKAGIMKLLATEEVTTFQIDSYNLVEPLFASKGNANFTGYSNEQVDKLLKQLTGLNLALKSERHKKLKEINQQLYKDKPVVVLFYIEKI